LTAAFSKLNVLLTGASGVIGRYLVPPFRTWYNLRTFDRDPGPDAEGGIIADLGDFATLKAAAKGSDVLVHLAATSDEAPFATELLPNNILGVHNAFQAACEAGVKRIVFASSCQVVGMYPKDQRIRIADPVRPQSVYGVTKVFGEVLGRYYHDLHGTDFVGIRLGAFAPYDHPALRRRSWLWRIWLSPQDAISLFRCAIEASKVGYAIVFGTSRVEPEYLSRRPAREVLGFVPQDSLGAAAKAGRRRKGNTDCGIASD
jgi:nucleoside-diphosphate-sugar epimerase